MTRDVDFTMRCIAVRPLAAAGVDCTGVIGSDAILATATVPRGTGRDAPGDDGPPVMPEPATWAQMIGGLCLVGLSLRRRGWTTVAA